MRGSRPLDLDLTARTRSDLDLILRVDFGLGGSDRTQPPAAALLAGEPFPAAERLGNSLEFTVNVALGVILTWVWVWDDQRTMRDPLEALVGFGEAQSGERKGGGGSARRGSPACECTGGAGLRLGCWESYVHVHCQGNPRQGRCVAVLLRRELATARLRGERRRSTGVRCSDLRCGLRAL